MTRLRRRTAPLASALLAASIAVTSCGNGSEPGDDPSQLDLDGRTFIGSNVTVDDMPFDLAKGSTLRLSFSADGQIGASGGCNSMGAAATWDDNTLRVTDGALAGTEMACDDALMQQDTWFADILTSGPTLTQDPQHHASLTVVSDTTVIVLTDEEAVVPDAALTGTLWTLDGIVTGPTVSSVPKGITSNLTLGHDGQLLAALGCNSGRGAFTLSDDVITIGPLATTTMACQPSASEVESAVLSVLQGDVQLSIDGETLTLTATKVSGDSATSLTYRATDG